MGRKAKIKTATGIVVEIRATTESQTEIRQPVHQEKQALPLMQEKKNSIYKTKPLAEKGSNAERNSKIYKTKPAAVPVWNEKPTITDKNRDMFRKKHLEIPVFLQKTNDEMLAEEPAVIAPVVAQNSEQTEDKEITKVIIIPDEPEIWTPVREAKIGLYEVSNHGRVKSYAVNKSGELLKGKIAKNSANVVEISINGKKKGFGINRLVAQHFVPNTENKTHVVHIDGNYQNNYYKNLQWMTQEELNNRDVIKKGKRGKITYEYAQQIRKMIEDKVPQHKIARMFRISSMQVTRIKRGENWAEN
jgi:hypothetical protein